jgi:hypothetical protein
MAIEFYDLRKDPIKNYFMEKIQMTLANKEALKMMMEQKRKQDEIKKLPPPPIVELGDEDEEEEGPLGQKGAKSDKKSKPRKHSDEKKKQHASNSDKKKERSRMINSFLRLEKINADPQQEINLLEVITKYRNAIIVNDEVIRMNLNEQEKTLKEKLDNKRSEMLTLLAAYHSIRVNTMEPCQEPIIQLCGLYPTCG